VEQTEIDNAISTLDKVILLNERFAHENQVYAEQVILGDGRLMYYPAKVNEDDYKPLTQRVLLGHLLGKVTVGLYQLDKDDRVKWLCLDVDINKATKQAPIVATMEELQQHTLQLGKLLRKSGVPFLVETSGNRGYHLWVFFETPIPARKARALGMWFVGKIPAPPGSHVEVYPKQMSRDEGGLGNLVKLPLGIHKKTGNRCWFVDYRFEPYPDQWEKLSGVRLWTEAEVDDFISKHEVMLPTLHVSNRDGLIGPLAPPCFVAIRDGVGEGVRDVAAFKYACYWRDRAADEEETLALMRVWNDRNNPPLDDAVLVEKVKSAFSRAYSIFPCRELMFDPYCSSSCMFYERKMAERGQAPT
jgi:hypothetical protein